MRRRSARAGVAVLTIAVAAATLWAGRVTLQDQVVPSEAASTPLTARAATATVGRVVPVNVSVRQPVQLVASNHLAGVVTGVGDQQTYAVGDTLYEVAGTRVRVVQGTVPFYRDLVPGVSGADVRQLQAALRDMRLLGNAKTGVYDVATQAAAQRWQRSVGAVSDGQLRLGEVVAVPSLPAPLRLADELRLAAVVAPGQEAVFGSAGEPAFELILPESQQDDVAADTTVRVLFEDRTWPAEVVGTRLDENGNTALVLSAPGGGPVCAADCAALPTAGETTLRGEIVAVPDVTGLAVPATAVRTDTGGQSYVLLRDGRRRPVTVRAAQQGLAVVDGLTAGDEVVLSAATEQPAGTPPASTPAAAEPSSDEAGG